MQAHNLYLSRLDLTHLLKMIRVTGLDRSVESLLKTQKVTLMIHTNYPIIKHKAERLNLAQELNNVSRARKVMDVARDTFYRYQELVAEGGIDAFDKSRRSPNRKNRVDESIKRPVKAYTVEWPAHASIEPVMNCVNKAYLYPVAAFAPSGSGMTWINLKSVLRQHWKPK